MVEQMKRAPQETFDLFLRGSAFQSSIVNCTQAVWLMVCCEPRAAWAAARRAIGTRYGEQET